MSHHKSRTLELDCHLGQLELEVLIVPKRSSKLLSSLNIFRSDIEALGGSTERAAGDVKSATIKTRKSDFETLTSLAYQVCFRDFAILQYN